MKRIIPGLMLALLFNTGLSVHGQPFNGDISIDAAAREARQEPTLDAPVSFERLKPLPNVVSSVYQDWDSPDAADTRPKSTHQASHASQTPPQSK